MGEPYQHTISGLLRRRSELMGDAQRLREELAHIGNDIEALDRTLISLGHKGDLKSVQPRGNRIVFIARDELRRFLLDELRLALQLLSSFLRNAVMTRWTGAQASKNPIADDGV
jgi:hypothetical protein